MPTIYIYQTCIYHLLHQFIYSLLITRQAAQLICLDIYNHTILVTGNYKQSINQIIVKKNNSQLMSALMAEIGKQFQSRTIMIVSPGCW